ncbi:glycerophosphodiester phosphodiesterase [Bacillaceae bacterium W0354]
MYTIRNKIILLLLILPLILWFLHFKPAPEIEKHSFFNFNHDGPIVVAHRGGVALAPENTIEAISLAQDIGVDVVEIDIHMTKDGHLVLMHDPSVDRTTDGKGLVQEYTLEEFLTLDAGYHFVDLEGNYSYRGLGLYKPTLKEVFASFPDMKFMLEVKHTNPKKVHDEIAKNLWDLIQQYGMEDQVLVSSFDQKVINSFDKYAKGRVALGTGRQIAFNFVLSHKLFMRNLFSPTGDVIQLPKKNRYFNFFTKSMIKGAQRIGMDIHYWTINDAKTMRKMIDAGVDGIITDRPDLLIEILKEKGYR